MTEERTGKERSNRTVALACGAFILGMIGMSYAAVPLYQLFCQVTGYGGTTQRAEQASDRIVDRMITVRFDANVAGGLPWGFKPVQREVKLRLGETGEAHYQAVNLAGAPTRGRATFNVTPMAAGAYFNKIECFCFTDTALKSGETLDMPVIFFVDPDIVDAPELRNVESITLSYTFFPIEGDGQHARAEKTTTLDENAGG